MLSSQTRQDLICALRDDCVPERVHLIPRPPYSTELNPCEQLWDEINDREGVVNGLCGEKRPFVQNAGERWMGA